MDVNRGGKGVRRRRLKGKALNQQAGAAHLSETREIQRLSAVWSGLLPRYRLACRQVRRTWPMTRNTVMQLRWLPLVVGALTFCRPLPAAASGDEAAQRADEETVADRLLRGQPTPISFE